MLRDSMTPRPGRPVVYGEVLTALRVAKVYSGDITGYLISNSDISDKDTEGASPESGL
jgi:hypothetical protein